MFVLTPLLLVLTTTYAASQMAIIEKVHITTITTVTGQNQTETWCDPKCDITYDYLMGVSTMLWQAKHGHANVYRNSAPTYLGSMES
jgi:hypothetical protein